MKPAYQSESAVTDIKTVRVKQGVTFSNVFQKKAETVEVFDP